MLSSKSSNFSFFLNQTIRNLSNGSLILSNKPKKLSKKKVFLELALKKRLQKGKKKKIIKKNLSDDFEDLWLDSLSLNNLKLYRKTSFGSFRRINEEKLVEKLRILYPVLQESTQKDCNKPQDESLSNNQTSSNKDELASPYLSEFFVTNMTTFPLLKSKVNDTLKFILKDEKEDYGIVDSVKFPSVTRILNDTMSESARLRLKEWKDKMIEKLGEEGFYQHQKDLLNNGAQFHSCLRQYLENGKKELPDNPEVKGCWRSLEKLLPEISDVKMVEESLYHPVLMYKGIVDCVASYRGTPCVIEWKKSDKKKSDLWATYDAPLQLCAYLGALGWRKDSNLKNGLVVVAYNDGTPANAFSMDFECCQVYWTEWLRRLQSYWVSKSSTLVQQPTEV